MCLSRIRSIWRNSLRIAFVVLVARPVCLIWLGMNVRRREMLPLAGPAVLIANHNSHLDTLALLCLFPLATVPSLRPAAAADYFMRNKLIAWLSLNVIGIVPVFRNNGASKNPLAGCYEALANNQIILVFPEGTRGEPEQLSELKSGIFFMAQQFPHVPVIPIYLNGMGKSMPKGACLPIPRLVDLYVGAPLEFVANKAEYLQRARQAFGALAKEHDQCFVQNGMPAQVTPLSTNLTILKVKNENRT